MNLVLLEEDIDLVTLSVNKSTGLHCQSELRRLGNIHWQELVECAVCQQVLVHWMGNTNGRVKATERSILHDGLTVIFKQCAHHFLMFHNSFRIILELRVIRIIRILDEQATNAVLRRIMHKEL